MINLAAKIADWVFDWRRRRESDVEVSVCTQVELQSTGTSLPRLICLQSKYLVRLSPGTGKYPGKVQLRTAQRPGT